MFTLCNVDPNHFFSLVDRCSGPVTVLTPDGDTIDLRQDGAARHLLLSVVGGGTLPCLSFSVDDPGDVSRVLRYMMESNRAG